MKSRGRFTVKIYQEIHGVKYPFTAVISANDANEAKKKAETTYSGYTALK